MRIAIQDLGDRLKGFTLGVYMFILRSTHITLNKMKIYLK